jgi:hypothetical protein
MSVSAKSLTACTVLLIFAIAFSRLELALAEQASHVIEKKAEPAAGALKLAPPTNDPTLPPPARPTVVTTKEQSARPVVRRPFLRPVESTKPVPATTALSVVEESMPAPELAPDEAIEVRPTPPIEYDTDGDARRTYRHSGQIELVMVTQNPADGCYYEIPMCIPGCCTDEPIVSSGRGIFGRGVVEYCWACGFRAKVKFRHVLGDVEVEYEGD